MAHRIVAVGDLHGDFTAWRAIAGDAHLIDAKGRWSGGAATLVQMGDVVDRGPDGRRLVLEFKRLQREAQRVGGRVVVLVGNHEAMNMTDDLRSVDPADFTAYTDADSAARRDRVFTAHRLAIEAAYRRSDPTLDADGVRKAWYAATPLGWLEHQAAWAPDGEIGRWVIGEPAVVLLDGALFVHGGIGPAYAHLPLAEINARVARALAARDTASTSIINDAQGPLWHRGWAGRQAVDDDNGPGASAPSPLLDEAELAKVLGAFGAQRMVIAHTSNLSGVVLTFDGRVIRVDTGISRVYGGVLGYLELQDGRPTPHVVPRPSPAGA